MASQKIYKFVVIITVFILLLSSTAMMGEDKKEDNQKEKKNETTGLEVQEEKNTGTAKFSKEMFEKLPKGRDFLSIVPLVPGINRDASMQSLVEATL